MASLLSDRRDIWRRRRLGRVGGRRSLALVLAVCAGLALTVPTAAVKLPDTDTPATDLRISLGELLAEHAYLVLGDMRATALDAPDQPALSAALASNTAALAGAIASVYGAQAGDTFQTLWSRHIDLLVRYADAARRHDPGAADAARSGLGEYRVAFSAFLAGANHHLSADGESQALQLHIDQLTAFADADYGQAYVAARAAYAHMFGLGDDLASAIAKQYPRRFPGAKVAFSPAAELRLTLDRLLGEHLVLSAEAMRSGIDGTLDSAASQAALDANTADLSAAVGSVYGGQAASAFSDLWATHTRVYVGYIAALRSDDAAAQAEALTSLGAYNEQVATFLGGANPRLDPATVSTMIAHHVQALVGMADAYAAKDYDRGVATIREAYRHMFDVGDALAAAIAGQFPDRFLDLRDLPDTDAVVPVPSPATPDATPWLLLTLAAAAVVLEQRTAGFRHVRSRTRRSSLPG